jgi:hypothetical protein
MRIVHRGISLVQQRKRVAPDCGKAYGNENFRLLAKRGFDIDSSLYND